MISDYIATTGSIFLSGAFVSLLYPSIQEEAISAKELEEKAIIIMTLLKDRAIHEINAPIIMEKLSCNAKVANEIINLLLKKGLIIISS